MSNTREKLAVDLFREGYNCSQSVLMAFEGIVSLDKETLCNISAPFGGGLGRQREVCGAVSGMCMAVGLLTPFASDDKQLGRSEVYKLTQDMCNEFKSIHGSIICRELLNIRTDKKEGTMPDARTAEYYASRPCEKCVEDCARLVVKYFPEIFMK